MAVGKNSSALWQVGYGENGVHALGLKCRARIDRKASARDLAAHDRDVKHLGEPDVVDIAAATDNEIVIFGTNLTPSKLTHFTFHPVSSCAGYAQSKLTT